MKNKSEKLAEVRALLAGKEPDEFKVIYWNSDSGEPKPPEPAPGKGLLVIINDDRMATLEKIIQEGQEMEAEKANKPHEPEPIPEVEAYTLPDISHEPVKPDQPTTTIFNQPTEVDFYIQRRAQAKRKTHF